jgi:hypothetical protein
MTSLLEHTVATMDREVTVGACYCNNNLAFYPTVALVFLVTLLLSSLVHNVA